MNVLLTGASGFVGRALALRLARDGHRLRAWSRSPQKAAEALGAEVEIVDAGQGPGALKQALTRSEAVVNLAGEPVVGSRWTAARRKALRTSRVDLTRDLVWAMASAERKPRVLVSASAVGFYGDRGAEILHEDSPPGTGFLADLCRDWEAAAGAATALGLRVVTRRIGVVLGAEGGYLQRVLPFFRLELGGPLGSGRQFVSWIHLDDRFARLAGGTLMEDVVYYALPLGWLGRLAHPLIVAPALQRIFDFRARAVALRFGSAPAVAPDTRAAATIDSGGRTDRQVPKELGDTRV